MRLIWAALAAAVLAGVPAGASAAEPAGGVKPPPKVEAEGAASTSTVTSIYTVEKLRDPFLKGGSAAAAKASVSSTEEGEDFSIHALALRGILKDAAVAYAVLSSGKGDAYILRKGQLFDHKGKLVAGISGTINVPAKTVNLITQDKDVQVYRLGAEEEEEDEK